MNIRDEIKMLLAKKNITMTKLAEKLSERKGKKISVKSISLKLTNQTIKYDEVQIILDIIGYKIRFRKDN